MSQHLVLESYRLLEGGRGIRSIFDDVDPYDGYLFVKVLNVHDSDAEVDKCNHDVDYLNPALEVLTQEVGRVYKVDEAHNHRQIGGCLAIYVLIGYRPSSAENVE